MRFLAFVLDRFLIGMFVKYTFVFFGYYPKLLMTQSEMLKYMDAGNFHISDVIDIQVFIIDMIVSSLLVVLYF